MINMSVRYTSNRKRTKQVLFDAEKRVLKAVGKAGEGYVKLVTPVAEVNGGSLRDSISYKVDDKSVVVGSTLMSEDYPIYVEKGTSKMAAQPYISTGMQGNLSQLKKIAEGAFRL